MPFIERRKNLSVNDGVRAIALMQFALYKGMALEIHGYDVWESTKPSSEMTMDELNQAIAFLRTVCQLPRED